MNQRQNEILTAALKLASRKGMQALTIKNISSEIGLTEAALYRHFESKHKILLGIIELFSRTTDTDFESAAYVESNFIEEIKNVILRRIEQFDSFPEIAYVMLSIDIFMNDEELRVAAIGSIHKHKECIEALLRKGQEAGQIRKDSAPTELCRIILGSFRLLLTQWYLTKHSFDLKTQFEPLWETISKLLRQ